MFENFALLQNCSDITIWEPLEILCFRKVIVIAMIMIIMVMVTVDHSSMTVDYGHDRELCGISRN